MPLVVDSGYVGQIKSLAGVLSAPGRGLSVNVESVDLLTSINKQVLQSNSCRKWAVLQNINADDITVFFGDIAAAGVAGVRLAKYGSLIINEDLSWTGAMTAFQDSGSTINLFVMEASIVQ